MMKGCLRPLWAFLSLLAVATISAQPVTSEEKADVLAKMGDLIGTSAFVVGADLKRWPELLQKYRSSIDETTTQAEFVGQVNRALQEFGFSHIVLSTPALAKARTEKKMVGLGIRIQIEDSGIRVINVFPDAPAKEAGIREGDLIIEANGKKPTSPADFAGEEGTTIKVKVLRDDQPLEFTVTRRTYNTVIPESLSWVNPATAHLVIPSFDNGYDSKNVEKLIVAAGKAKNLILDLRSNGGGAVTNLLHLAGLLLPPEGDLGTFVTRSTVERYVAETKGDPKDLAAIATWSQSKLRPFRPKVDRFQGKIVVLINGGTGSAAEMLAAALHDTLKAPLIGSKSAGAVLASVMAKLPHGYQLQYPIFDYVTGKGFRIEGKGLTPDIEAPFAKYGEPDKAISASLEWFKSATTTGSGSG
jgi:carboxyl-terminal processing protease